MPYSSCDRARFFFYFSGPKKQLEFILSEANPWQNSNDYIKDAQGLSVTVRLSCEYK